MNTIDFTNLLLSDWEDAMDRFFGDVERRMREHKLSPEEVRDALIRGYGSEVGDAWDQWAEEMFE